MQKKLLNRVVISISLSIIALFIFSLLNNLSIGDSNVKQKKEAQLKNIDELITIIESYQLNPTIINLTSPVSDRITGTQIAIHNSPNHLLDKLMPLFTKGLQNGLLINATVQENIYTARNKDVKNIYLVSYDVREVFKHGDFIDISEGALF